MKKERNAMKTPEQYLRLTQENERLRTLCWHCVKVAENYMNNNPAFGLRPRGTPHSDPHIEQTRHITAEDDLRNVCAALRKEIN